MNCQPSEIYFTSGGSESNSWALQDKFYCHDYEHHSILNNPNRQKERNQNYIYAQMLVNNETGTVFTSDIKMATMMRNNRVHCDATQAIGNIDVNVKKLKDAGWIISCHKNWLKRKAKTPIKCNKFKQNLTRFRKNDK